MMGIYKGNPCKNGHDGRRYEGSRGCVECQKARSKTAKAKAASKVAQRKYYEKVSSSILDKQKEYRTTPRGRALQMMQSVRSRSKSKGMGMDVDVDWIVERLKVGKCEITKLPFDFSVQGMKGPFAPSLDRIDSTKGYFKSNCRIVLWALNTAFSWWGEDVFKEIALSWLLSDCGESHDRDVNAAKNILALRHRASVCGNEQPKVAA